MTRSGGVLLAAGLASMIALPDFSAHEWEIESGGESIPVRSCIKALPSSDAQVGTVLRFVGRCPYGWLHANGQYIVRELYPDLYAVLESLAGPPARSGAQ